MVQHELNQIDSQIVADDLEINDLLNQPLNVVVLLEAYIHSIHVDHLDVHKNYLKWK